MATILIVEDDPSINELLYTPPRRGNTHTYSRAIIISLIPLAGRGQQAYNKPIYMRRGS